jgi:hypothetical protein
VGFDNGHKTGTGGKRQDVKTLGLWLAPDQSGSDVIAQVDAIRRALEETRADVVVFPEGWLDATYWLDLGPANIRKCAEDAISFHDEGCPTTSATSSARHFGIGLVRTMSNC